MPRCTVPGCTNDSSKKECSNLSWFRYPVSNRKLLRQWLAQVSRLDFHPNRDARICSAHFTSDCFVSDYCFLDEFVASGDMAQGPPGKKRRSRKLKDDAVPTLFPARQSRGQSSQVAATRRSSYLERKAHREVSLSSDRMREVTCL